MYGNQDPFYGAGANQNYLQSLSGQPVQPQHQVEHIIETAVEMTIWSYILGWFFRKAWHRPAPFILFVACAISVTAISVHEQHFFWPVWIPLVIGFLALGRTVRR